MMKCRRLSLATIAISAILALAFEARANEAPMKPPAAPTNIPGQWVALVERPTLWDAPNGTPKDSPLPVKPGDRVAADQRKLFSSEPATPWIHVQLLNSQGWAPEALFAPPPQEVSAADLKQVGQEPVDRYHGIPASYVPPDLVEISHGYTQEMKYKLRREAAAAFEKMAAAAKREKVELRVVSAYRNWETQRGVYMKKIKAAGWNQKTVAKPGHSEHQLGTALDLCEVDPKTQLEEAFGETIAGKWLRARAPDFGFAVSYTKANEAATGYSPEPWHYRYWGKEAARAKHEAALNGE